MLSFLASVISFLSYVVIFLCGIILATFISKIPPADKNFIRGNYYLLRNQNILCIGIVCVPGKGFSGLDKDGKTVVGSINQEVEYTINNSNYLYTTREAFQTFFNENVIENLNELEAKQRLKNIKDSLAKI